ncbi:hypothetical protein Patl1_25534 [Pistacia atlantica]|uniref:Uncharacterized protein n=1 Tax=Pistacia atlantica TaxID=434234 RepID=A0ACC1AZQ2_9ROSI|nr:hypothetical protein Patl1_25534 [Pistacia atlantica]
MASAVDAAGDPIPTSAVLMSASKHIGTRCQPENVEYLKCKKSDPNPEKCLDKGRQVTRCVLGLFVLGIQFKTRSGILIIPCKLSLHELTKSLNLWLIGCKDRLKDLHQRCTKEMDDYVGCMYYHTNEFDLCRKEQEAFEKACPLE